MKRKTIVRLLNCSIIKSGFTLIELLIVIAVIGVLSVGVLTALNVTSQLGKANLSKAKTFSASVENSLSINQVGKWSFEEGAGATTFKDTSGYGNNGSCLGASCPTWRNVTDCGLGFGECFGFNGSGQHVDAGTNVPATESAFTITMWVKLNGRGGLLSRSTGVGWQDERLVLHQYSTNKLALTLSDGIGYLTRDSTSDLPLNRWVHIAVAWNGSTTKFYLDGKLDATVNHAQTTIHAGIKTWIGKVEGLPPNDANGLIDEVAIYNQVLLSSQIQQLYAQGFVKHLLALR